MATKVYTQKRGYSLIGHLFGRCCWVLACQPYLAILIRLPKMNKIYQVVSAIAPPPTPGPPVISFVWMPHVTVASMGGFQRHCCMGGFQWCNVTHVWRHLARRVARDVIVTSDISAAEPWACQILNFSNWTIISWDTANFVKEGMHSGQNPWICMRDGVNYKGN